MIAIVDNLRLLIPNDQDITSFFTYRAEMGIVFYTGLHPDDLPVLIDAMAGMRAQLDKFTTRLIAMKASPTRAPLQKVYGLSAAQGYNRFHCILELASHVAELSLSKWLG